MARVVKVRASKWVWGVALLLIAALILSNYFGGFVELGVWSIIFATVALVVLVTSIAYLSIASLPLPLAALYYIFQTPLDLPHIQFWPLALVTVLVTVGLYVLIPRRFRVRKRYRVILDDGEKRTYGGDAHSRRNRRYGQRAVDYKNQWSGDGDDEQADVVIEEGDDDNNPYISVKLGGISRYLRSERLETVRLDCSLGGLEVYFDHVQLSPDGAEAFVDCSLGSVEMYVPGHWRVINDISASLGNVEVDSRLESAPMDSPTLTVTGSVSLGSVEIHRIKG